MIATIGKAGLRDAPIGTGVAVDKVLALTGQMPTVQIANIVMPSAEERAEIDALHRAPDAIARRLREARRIESCDQQQCVAGWFTSAQQRQYGVRCGRGRRASAAPNPQSSG
jgi:hypothetical protein